MKTERTSLFLMANLGAEVSRIILARNKNDSKLTLEALNRARKIIDQIKSCPDMESRAGEIKLLDEAIQDSASDNPRFKIMPQNLLSYFTPFTMRLMSSH